MTVSALTDFQMQISVDGSSVPPTLVIGPTTNYLITEVDGFGVPTVRSDDLPKPEDIGAYFGRDLIGQRMITVKMTVVGTSQSNALDNLDALFSAWQLATPDGSAFMQLYYKLPGRTARFFKGRPRDVVVDWTAVQGSQIPVTLLFATADPAAYDSTAHTTNATIVTAGTPVTLSAANGGNFRTLPLVTINGPITNPSIKNVNTGETLSFTAILGALDSLVIDFNNRTVTNGLSGNQYFQKDPTSVWWEMAAATTTNIQFNCTAKGSGNGCLVAWNNAYLS